MEIYSSLKRRVCDFHRVNQEVALNFVLLIADRKNKLFSMNKMKHQIMNPFLLIALSLFSLFGLTSCLEESTVVKINKDGSGVIHIRSYKNSPNGKLFSGGDDEEKKEKADGPTEMELKALAKKMGEGVTLKSHSIGKNKSGWNGYEAIFAFEDINKVKVEFGVKKANDLKKKEEKAEGEEKVKIPELVTFEMRDGMLKINTPEPSFDKDGKSAQNGQEAGGGAQDPFGADSSEGSAMMAMMAPMFAGARMGFFVEIDGEVVETDAKHRKGNMITIMRMDLGQVMANPKAISKLNALEGGSRKEIQTAVDSVDGLKMDLQETITVKVK